MAAAKKYRRLPGRSISTGARNSIWLGEDHLLKLTYAGYHEEYRRFYFRDIQAISYARNRVRWGWNIFWGFFLLIAGIMVGAGNEAARISGLILGVIPLVALLVNTALGPTCHCRLRTAVQDEKLTSVGRVRAARKLLEIVRPYILEAQPVAAPIVAPAQAVAEAGAQGEIPPTETVQPEPAPGQEET